MIRGLLAVACLAYIGWPLPDFIPDAMPFVGTVDDGLAGFLLAVVMTYRNRKERTK